MVLLKRMLKNPVNRLFPRDKYENIADVIPVETLNKYTVHFKSQKFINCLLFEIK